MGVDSAASCHRRNLSVFGAPPKPEKAVGPSLQFPNLGAVIECDSILTHGRLILEPRVLMLANVQEALSVVFASVSLTSAQAAKLRGQCGGTSSLSFGRIGRGAMWFLKRRRYSDTSEVTVLAEDMAELAFLHTHSWRVFFLDTLVCWTLDPRHCCYTLMPHGQAHGMVPIL